ncbi:hypothetical protein [Myroides sp. WP-1]|uniref:hypothetical protein n=1 Tax=Myroides sp. WP-1 TaxID=2759944 RepID=UPI0015FBD25C|nr:hypothetical protein [Myroides sp. WP-1]MBB1140948.1 hypothetical protein [Myroides sp. WP-1]
MKKYNLQTLLVLLFLSLISTEIQAQNQSFGQKIGVLMYEMTTSNPDPIKIEQLLQTLDIDDKEVKTGQLSYSIFDGFDGDKMYYIPFTTAEESRFTVEQLKQDEQLYFGVQFLLKSSYNISKDGQITYNDSKYAYNVHYEELLPLCTTPMKYKNGSGNNPNSPLLSCIYTNPDSKKRMMYWVVFEKPIGDTQSNTIKEIKFQSIELWQK